MIVKLLIERLRSDWMNSDCIRIYGVFDNESDLDRAIKNVKPYENDGLEIKEIEFNELINVDLNIWIHDD